MLEIRSNLRIAAGTGALMWPVHFAYHSVGFIPIASAISSAMCRTRVGTSLRWHIPAMFIVHPASLQIVVSALVAAMQLT
ncbi:MAG: hypothetical protein JWN40_1768, partial [Phycisphaerales bacterium]|nr:hypothetical protein [Phycisphaerales bacterium]